MGRGKYCRLAMFCASLDHWYGWIRLGRRPCFQSLQPGLWQEKSAARYPVLSGQRLQEVVWSIVCLHHNQTMVTLSRSEIGGAGNWSRAGVSAATVLVWALAAACALYWGLRLTAVKTATAPLPPVVQTAADPQLVARLLGARAASPAVQASLASRFSLQGVVAGGPSGGAALIAVDGKAARPFAIGSEIEEGLVLKSTTARSVALAASRSSATLLTLEMPLLK